MESKWKPKPIQNRKSDGQKDMPKTMLEFGEGTKMNFEMFIDYLINKLKFFYYKI